MSPTTVPVAAPAERPGTRAWLRGLIAAAVLVLALVATAAPARAHTELTASTPEDGATLAEPVDALELTFSLPVTTLPDGMVLSGPDGDIEVTVSQEGDGEIVVVTPADALAGGSFSLAWTILAEDGHPRDGTIGFVVEAPAATAEPEPEPTDPSASATNPEATQSPAPTKDPEDEPTPTPSASAMQTDDAESGPSGETAATIVARAGSSLALWALLVGAGTLVFVATSMRGRDEADAPRTLALVRWMGVGVLVGVAIRIVGRSAQFQGGSFADAFAPDALELALTGTVAWVVGLQAVGGLLMLVGTGRTSGRSWLAWLGVVVAGAGHVLGGHSNTAEPRALVLVADVAHLVAAAVWVGGATALAIVLRRRRREGRPLDARGMGARFGVIASVAVVTVGLAGVALTWAIVDELSDLWTSTWGITLIVKVAIVAIVAGLGAYTHFRVVPRLAGPADAPVEADADRHLASGAAAEAWLFAGVVVATAVLVAGSIHE